MVSTMLSSMVSTMLSVMFSTVLSKTMVSTMSSTMLITMLPCCYHVTFLLQFLTISDHITTLLTIYHFLTMLPFCYQVTILLLFISCYHCFYHLLPFVTLLGGSILGTFWENLEISSSCNFYAVWSWAMSRHAKWSWRSRFSKSVIVQTIGSLSKSLSLPKWKIPLFLLF